MWTVKSGIDTPKGKYFPKTDNLVNEIMEAATFAGLESFDVLVDGVYVDTPADLQAQNFSDVKTVSIEPYDTAG